MHRHFLQLAAQKASLNASSSTLSRTARRAIDGRISHASRAAASFHTSSRRRDEIPRSPYQIFVETLKEELRKSKELQDNVKTLQGDVDKLQDSESMKRAKDMYERARVGGV